MGERITMSKLHNLPTEILFEIFLRLPVRSLLRCKCVCKPFRNLIINPNFIASHLNRFRSNPNNDAKAILTVSDHFDWKSGRTPKYLLSIDHKTSHLHSSSYATPFPVVGESIIFGSCNGLLCADVISVDLVVKTRNHSFLLFNPVTRQNRFLPKPQIDFNGYWDYHVLGFGFVPETNDYKIVRIVYFLKTMMKIEVYRMSTDSWTILEYKMPVGYDSKLLYMIRRGKTSVFLKGAFHWFARYENGVVILYFNLENEEFGLMNYFDYGSRELSYQRSLAVIDESLAMIGWEGRHGFKIWVMNDYGVEDSWALRYRVVEGISKSVLAGYWTNGLMIVRENNREMYRAFLYDINTRERTEIPTLEDVNIINFVSYVETLAPVSRGEEVSGEAN